MNNSEILAQLKLDAGVRAPIFPEPVQVITTVPMGSASAKGRAPVRSTNRSSPLTQLAMLDTSPGRVLFDGNGILTASESEGKFTATARAGEVSQMTSVTIVDGTLPLPPPLLSKARKLSWARQVITQKWMNFYTKDLARFATDKGLKLVVSVEILRPVTEGA